MGQFKEEWIRFVLEKELDRIDGIRRMSLVFFLFPEETGKKGSAYNRENG